MRLSHSLGFVLFCLFCVFQCAETLVTDDADLEAIRNISFYRKFNRMRDGDIAVNAQAPYVHKPLFRLDGSEFRFFEDFLQYAPHKSESVPASAVVGPPVFTRPCVVIAASHS